MALLKPFQANRFPAPHHLFQTTRTYAKFRDKELTKCYRLLGVSEDSDQEQVRAVYLDLVKRFHPDSGSSEADSDKFQEIDTAFRVIVNRKSRERWGAETIDLEIHAQEFDIKHTAPQHRQFLNYGGLGFGTPFQRAKQFGKLRAMHAVESVLNHRLHKAQADDKTLVDKKPAQKHKIQTKYGYDRLVEDLIQEAMQKGQFDNLSGIGKPLREQPTVNPYVDFVTHKINQVLIDNGFTPEWIMLQKEIREAKLQLQRRLHAARAKLGVYPFTGADEARWARSLATSRDLSASINRKIEKYNLVVPVLQKQMLQVNLVREAEKVARDGESRHEVEARAAPSKNEAMENPRNIFSFFESFFYTK